MLQELDRVLMAARSEDPAGVVLHSTTPGVFVAGADLVELRSMNHDDGWAAGSVSARDGRSR